MYESKHDITENVYAQNVNGINKPVMALKHHGPEIQRFASHDAILKNMKSDLIRGGIKIEYRENLGQCPNYGWPLPSPPPTFGIFLNFRHFWTSPPSAWEVAMSAMHIKLSWKTLKVFLKLPWDTLETSLKIMKHPWNIPETSPYIKLLWNTFETSLKHPFVKLQT